MPSPKTPADFLALISAPTSSMCDNLINTLLKLPVALHAFIAWLLDSDGNISTEVKSTIIGYTYQPGDLKMACGTVADGWLMCNGQAVSRTTYAALFAVVGTVFGAGDAVTTFNVPDFRDRFPIGAGNKAVGNQGGDATKTLVLANVPPHTHDCSAVKQGGTTDGAFEIFQANESSADPAVSNPVTLVTKSAGGLGSPAAATAFDVLNPYIAVNFVIKV